MFLPNPKPVSQLNILTCLIEEEHMHRRNYLFISLWPVTARVSFSRLNLRRNDNMFDRESVKQLNKKDNKVTEYMSVVFVTITTIFVFLGIIFVLYNL